MSAKNLVQPPPEFVVKEARCRVVYLPDGSLADMTTQVLFNSDKILRSIRLEKIERVLQNARKSRK